MVRVSKLRGEVHAFLFGQLEIGCERLPVQLVFGQLLLRFLYVAKLDCELSLPQTDLLAESTELLVRFLLSSL